MAGNKANLFLIELKKKVRQLKESADKLIQILEDFGWEDQRPDLIPETTYLEELMMSNSRPIKEKRKVPPSFAQNYQQ